MNIVKGVADLIWRSSSGQTGEHGSQSGRFPPPTPRITFRYLCFSLLADNMIQDHYLGGLLGFQIHPLNLHVDSFKF